VNKAEIHWHAVIKMIALMMKAVGTSQTPIYFYETTRRHIAEGSRLHN
jgi:hypothetical protein